MVIDALLCLEQVLEDGLVRSVYQPIVRLDTEEVVGFEALSRGPAGTPVESPEDMFEAARHAGRVVELDALCMARAVEGAHGLLPGWCPLFINVEPTTLSSRVVELTGPIEAAGGRSIMLEVTERAITRAPETLLAGVDAARARGWRIALDDVGVDTGSLAFLPIIRPDVIKLDMALLHDHPNRDLGRTMAAVMAYTERTGAILLAEGIESDEHLERAISLGAIWGQGFRFGRPSLLTSRAADLPPQALPIPSGTAPRAVLLSPYDAVLAAGREPRVARKNVLLQISHHLEEQALSDPNDPLILSAFQHARHFTPDTRRRYRSLADHCSLCAALGIDMDPEPLKGVRGGVIGPGDPLVDEWSVVVLGPHYGGALLGKDLGEIHDAEADRRFSFFVTHERGLVELAAESLLRRVLST